MSESDTHDDRIIQSWKVFHKWAHILQAFRTPLKARIAIWLKTVCISFHWGLETCRGNSASLKKLHSVQCLQFAKMMGLEDVLFKIHLKSGSLGKRDATGLPPK